MKRVMKTLSPSYIPGVCNIGPAEIKKRRQGGYIGLGLTALVLILLVGFHAPTTSRFLIFIPMMLASIGFLQSRLHFCVGFAASGLFNVGAAVGQTESVDQVEFRAQDRRKAILILGGSLLISLVTALIAVII